MQKLNPSAASFVPRTSFQSLYNRQFPPLEDNCGNKENEDDEFLIGQTDCKLESLPIFRVSQTALKELESEEYKFSTPIPSPSELFDATNYLFEDEEEENNRCPNNLTNCNTPKNQICPYFVEGVCQFGKSCKYLHPQNEELVDTIQFHGDLECNICYQKIRAHDRKFGLLSHCSHPFCLDCIRKWRGTYSTEVDKQTFRLCPVCRIESYVVIPSDKYIINTEEKLAILNGYKAQLSSIPCKYFKSGINDSCPFGNSCFYAHTNRDGSAYVVPRKGIVMNEDGNIIADRDFLLSDIIRFEEY